MKVISRWSLLFCCVWVCAFVEGYTQFGRKAFPSNFTFGFGSAAYQYEGAFREDGKGLSVWDTFAHTPGKISDQSNGDVADDQYHRYKEDVKLLVDSGVDSYRFSISWTRIFPKGRGIVNKKGLTHYNNLIDELLKNGIKPLVTIFHWDLPQVLQDEYGGFLSEKIVKDFTSYANTCFEAFGDRVKNWVTINELISVSVYGYNYGSLAPGRCSKTVGNCTAGNSATETYIVAHNLLLSHAATVKLYRDKYQKKQKGSIGITLVTHWFLPHSNSLADYRASRRTLDFFFGWFVALAIFIFFVEGLYIIQFIFSLVPRSRSIYSAKVVRGTIPASSPINASRSLYSARFDPSWTLCEPNFTNGPTAV